MSVATMYEGAAKELLWELKFKGAQAAAESMAKRMVFHFDYAPGTWIVPVPTATKRVRQRGYDQAKTLARQLSKHAAMPYLDCLARMGQAHQVGAARRERLTQLSGAFRTSLSPFMKDAHILLIDDVMTTGATLEAAATALREAGVRKISAAVFAQP